MFFKVPLNVRLTAPGVLQVAEQELFFRKSVHRKPPFTPALFVPSHEEREEIFMEFFNSAVDVLQTLVIALGAGLGIWGVINLLEGYGNDNPGANAHVP